MFVAALALSWAACLVVEEEEEEEEESEEEVEDVKVAEEVEEVVEVAEGKAVEGDLMDVTGVVTLVLTADLPDELTFGDAFAVAFGEGSVWELVCRLLTCASNLCLFNKLSLLSWLLAVDAFRFVTR